MKIMNTSFKLRAWCLCKPKLHPTPPNTSRVYSNLIPHTITYSDVSQVPLLQIIEFLILNHLFSSCLFLYLYNLRFLLLSCKVLLNFTLSYPLTKLTFMGPRYYFLNHSGIRYSNLGSTHHPIFLLKTMTQQNKSIIPLNIQIPL